MYCLGSLCLSMHLSSSVHLDTYDHVGTIVTVVTRVRSLKTVKSSAVYTLDLPCHCTEYCIQLIAM